MPRKVGTPKTGGRQRGVRNKKTAEVIEQAAAGGVMPIDVMLENMRYAHDMMQRTAVGEALKYRMMAEECAKDAAPYLHSRLTATEVSGSDQGPIVHEIIVKYVKADQAGD